MIFFWVFVFTLFRGLRWDTGTDWAQYCEVFLDAKWSNIFTYNRGFSIMEPGYMFINILLKSIINNYTFFLLTTNFFILYVYARFALTNSKTPIYVFVLIMFSTQFFPVRIGIAVGFVLLGLLNYSDKRHIRLIICTLIASGIHSSAIIFIPCYFICFYKRLPTMLALLTSVGALVLVQVDIISTVFSEISFVMGMFGEQNADKFEHYLDYTESQVVSGVSSILNAVIFIFTLYLFGRYIEKKETGNDSAGYTFMYNMYFIFVIIGILFSSENMANLKRLQNYFMFPFPILFSSYIVWAKEKYPKLKYCFSIALLFYILFRCYTLFFSGFPDELFPYFSIFDSNPHRS